MSPRWIPLHVHSQYSILDSTASVAALAERAKRLSLPSLALTDQGNLYGAVDFYKACKAAGVKPILGCEIWMAPRGRHEKKREPEGRPSGLPILLLVKNSEGYRNLCHLSSIGFLEGFYFAPRIDKEVLEKHAKGLICLSGPLEGPISDQILHGTEESLVEEISWYKDLFGEDFYLEIQRTPLDEAKMGSEAWLVQRAKEYVSLEEKRNRRLIDLAKKFSIPLVATHPIHYIEPEDFAAHEVLLNIQSGEPCLIWERDSEGHPKGRVPNPKRQVRSTRELYFRLPEEMERLFADLPEAIAATEKIAASCSFAFDFQAKYYPTFVPPLLQGKEISGEEREKAARDFLHDLCQQGIERRYQQDQLQEIAKVYPGKDPLAVVKERFAYEFSVITSKGMTDYMLIVYDFIDWAKKRKIPMGPGRGSAAGSIISYLIGITDIEPLRFHLFFERFINPERISYPDIDVDICMERRQEVIDYVVAKYGKERVAQIITFGTMKARMAIRDVGRALDVPLAKVNQIAALVPEDPNMTLEKALQIDGDLGRKMEEDEETRLLLEMAKKAEGSIRNTSTHAAGLIISEHPIIHHLPVCMPKDSQMVVTQYAMKPVESIGMLKIDFLGLKTLTAIQRCVDSIAEEHHREIDWVNLPLNDTPTFDLLNQGKTFGVFQLESSGMQDLAKQLHIDVFEEIIAVGALYRPGPMDMIPSFIQRKHGREAIEIDHPLMAEVLQETYGVMVYQEQVMQIASLLAGYTLGEGDMLRRAMGKKDREEMARQREKFLQGSKGKGVSPEIAGAIFDKIEKFASYGFNKSHAAAYGYLSYVTAFLKAHFPQEWMAALMTCNRDNLTEVTSCIAESQALQIPVLPPDINQSSCVFRGTERGIRFALSGIKGIGQAVVEHILKERQGKGSFASLYEFIERVDKSCVGKKQIEILSEAGCFDFTGWSRDQLRSSVEEMYSTALHKAKEESAGILSLFSELEEPLFTSAPEVKNSSPKEELLQREKELLGFFLTGHPLEAFRPAFRELSCVPLQEISSLPDGSLFRAAFLIDTIQVKIAQKTQKKFAILTVEDGFARAVITVWSDLYIAELPLLRENQLVYAILQVEKREEERNLVCKALTDLAHADAKKCQEWDALSQKLRASAKHFETKRRSMSAKEEPKENSPCYSFSIDAGRVRLSQILALKKLFRSSPGSSPVEIEFSLNSKVIGKLAIEARWGVALSETLQQEVGRITGGQDGQD
ncbi:MAG: DNA polymerase III subunit alpha [Verrucomicrobiota bacterium]|nr:DNA polymerase III subunit alpha [Verrucomicrobiota bacterium]